MNRDEFFKKYREFKERIENDPELEYQINNRIEELKEMIGMEFQIVFVGDVDLSEHTDNPEDELESPLLDLGIDPANYQSPELQMDKTMTLGKLKEVLDSESDEDLKVFIDPLHLEKGVNEITDLITVVVNDNIIVVPINDKEKDD